MTKILGEKNIISVIWMSLVMIMDDFRCTTTFMKVTIRRADDLFFYLAMVVTLPGILFGIWFSRWGYHYTEELTRCTFRLNTGLPCPGCGGTRAFILFFQGEFFLSFCYHPAVLTLAVCYLHFIILYLYRRFRRNKPLTVRNTGTDLSPMYLLA